MGLTLWASELLAAVQEHAEDLSTLCHCRSIQTPFLPLSRSLWNALPLSTSSAVPVQASTRSSKDTCWHDCQRGFQIHRDIRLYAAQAADGKSMTLACPNTLGLVPCPCPCQSVSNLNPSPDLPQHPITTASHRQSGLPSMLCEGRQTTCGSRARVWDKVRQSSPKHLAILNCASACVALGFESKPLTKDTWMIMLPRRGFLHHIQCCQFLPCLRLALSVQRYWPSDKDWGCLSVRKWPRSPFVNSLATSARDPQGRCSGCVFCKS